MLSVKNGPAATPQDPIPSSNMPHRVSGDRRAGACLVDTYINITLFTASSGWNEAAGIYKLVGRGRYDMVHGNLPICMIKIALLALVNCLFNLKGCSA